MKTKDQIQEMITWYKNNLDELRISEMKSKDTDERNRLRHIIDCQYIKMTQLLWVLKVE